MTCNYLTVPQIAKELGKRRSFVEEQILSGALAAVNLSSKKSRRDWRVTRKNLTAFLESRAVVPNLPLIRGRKSRKRVPTHRLPL